MEAIASSREVFGSAELCCYNPAVRALALDVGSKRIGLALADAGGVVASAWKVIERSGNAADAKQILDSAKSEAVEQIVVGLPLELDGTQGRRARLVRRFVGVLEGAIAEHGGPSVTLWDERFSTAAAERTLLEADVSRRGRKDKIDAVAAQFILQGWIDGQAAASRRSRPDEVDA